MKLEDRIKAIVRASSEFPWLGKVTLETVWEWLRLELGDPPLMPQRYGPHHAVAIPYSPILHIVSGNTPHAALQSLIRGILLGAENLVKIPSDGLPEIERFVRLFPKPIQPLLERSLPGAWLETAAAIVVFGSDETIASFASRVSPWQRFLPHGNKVSFAIILGDWLESTAQAAARDVHIFDQLGCLSPQFFYVENNPEGFGSQIATELENLARRDSFPERTIESVATIRGFREDWRFRAAMEPRIRVWESEASLEWTVILDPDPEVRSSPLHRTIFIKQLPARPEKTLAHVKRFISTIGLSPLDSETVQLAVRLGAQRICPVGEMQSPSLIWHQDGWPSLSSLVRFVDIEGVGTDL
ncbi:MAG: acyl-CoA reductase [Chthoniobacterales bacterium]